MDYSAFFNKISRATKPNTLREMFDTFSIDASYVLMAGGLPNSQLFPIKGIQLTLADGTHIDIDKKEVSIGMQYGKSFGYDDLRGFVTDLTKRLHDPPTLQTPDHPGAHCMILTSGAQDAIYKTMNTLLEEGDTLIIEEYVYANVITTIKPMGCSMLSVQMDQYGIVPGHLETVLSKWPKPQDGKPSNGRLKALYCVPNGHNPTGGRYTSERKRQIYRLAHEYNFIIIEDDAYYFMEEKPHSDSFLSMDVDGRVIRIETFSKTMGPGFRIGFVSAPRPIYKQLLCASQASTQGCSHLSQIILTQLLRKRGVDGYIEHCERVCQFYSDRRNACDRIARKHLQGLAEWSIPSGGMFLWVRLPHVSDSESFVMETLVANKVLIVCGSAFHAEDGFKTSYVRISYSNASDENMEKGFAIMAEQIRKLKK